VLLGAGELSDRARALLHAARQGGGVKLAIADLPAAHELAALGLALDESIVRPGGTAWVLRAVGRGSLVPVFPILCPRCSGRGFVGWARAACPECACWKCGGPRSRGGSSTSCVRCEESKGV
jgi:hypothetical protein